MSGVPIMQRTVDAGDRLKRQVIEGPPVTTVRAFSWLLHYKSDALSLVTWGERPTRKSYFPAGIRDCGSDFRLQRRGLGFRPSALPVLPAQVGAAP